MDTLTPRGLLIAAGLVLVAVGGQPFLNFISGDTSLRSIVPSVVVTTIGLVLVLFGFFWKPKPVPPEGMGMLRRRLIAWSNSPIPYAIMFLMVWVYFETLAIQRNNEIVGLRNDEHAISEILERFVLPRRLSELQANQIVGYLQNYGPTPAPEVAFEQAQGDDEAGDYRGQLQRALDKAGWHLRTDNAITFVSNPNYDLAVNVVNDKSRPTVPKAGETLLVAFGLAGVKLQSSSAGEGNVVVISVGHRRRDPYVLPWQPQ